MDTNGHEGGKLLQGELVYSIVGGALEALREVGRGLHEHPYENGLVVVFGLRNVRVDQQRRYPVFSKNVQISEFVQTSSSRMLWWWMPKLSIELLTMSAAKC